MEFLAPGSWVEALEARHEFPDALPIAGGTDVMVDLNFDRHRPPALIDLTRVRELTQWSRSDDGGLRLGAGVTYSRLMAELADVAPGLVMASRTVGSPQIRARGTVGGNLGSASPAGDCHPVLLAVDAAVEVASVRGSRTMPVADFFTGVKQNALEPDELIAAVLLPAGAGLEQFAKIGTRNAMVIAVTSFGLALHPQRQAVGAAIGSAAPTPRHSTEAEEFLAQTLAADGLWESRGTLPTSTATRFGELVADAAAPIDDVRGTAAYRRHALSVLARRTLGWAWSDYQTKAA